MTRSFSKELIYIKPLVISNKGVEFDYNRIDLALILGDAGTGKTLFCHFGIFESLTSQEQVTILPLTGRTLKDYTLSEVLEDFLLESRKAFPEIKPTIVLDGLDEIPYNSSWQQFEELLSKKDDFRIIVTSRPHIYRQLPGFEIFYINYDKEFIQKFVRAKFKDNKADDFIALLNNLNFNSLARSPLLLTLLCQIYERHGDLPRSVSVICKSSLDLTFEYWYNHTLKGGKRLSSAIGASILQKVAYWMFDNNIRELSVQKIQEILHHFELSNEELSSLLSSLVRSAILSENDKGIISFGHLMFQHYLAAQYMCVEPNFDISKLSNKADVFQFYLELTYNKINLFGQLLEREMYTEAKLCAHLIKLKNGDNMLSLLTRMQDSDIFQPSPNTIKIKKNRSFISGKNFEDVVEKLFAKNFHILNRNHRTHHGEIDIIIEHLNLDIWWGTYSNTYFIECKNWKEKIGLPEVNHFTSKIDRSRISLGFIVAPLGFTKDAMDAIRTIASNPLNPLIVPIIYNEGLSNLNNIEFDEFLKDQIRKTKIGSLT